MSDTANPYEPTMSTSGDALAAHANYKGLKGTAIGLKIIYFSILLMLLCIIGGIVAAAALPVAIIPLGLLVLVAYLMLLIGPFFCLSAPESTGAQGLIIGSILCQAAGLLISVAPMVGIAIPGVVSSATSMITMIGSILFILFMMKISSYIQRDDLREKGRTILVGSVILFVLLLIGVVGVTVLGPIAGILSLVAALGMLVIFVMYANLVNSLYKAIESLQR